MLKLLNVISPIEGPPRRRRPWDRMDKSPRKGIGDRQEDDVIRIIPLLFALGLAVSTSGCKARQAESQAKDSEQPALPAPEQENPEFTPGPDDLPDVCQDRSASATDPTLACTRVYCDFLLNDRPLPFYKVLDTDGYLNDVAGRGRILKSADKVIEGLSAASDTLESLYNCDSGVRERVLDPSGMARVEGQLTKAWPAGEYKAGQAGKPGLPYTIAFHTRRVLQVFNDQRKFYEIPNTTLDGYRYQSYPLMIWLLSMHDIGKPVAAELKNTHLQHQYLPQIVRAALTRMSFPAYEVELGVRIIDHDLIGEYMQTRDPARAKAMRERAVQGIRDRAKASNLAAKDYWVLQRLFYIADSTSYAIVRSNYFGRLGKNGPEKFGDAGTTKGTGSTFDSAELLAAGGQIVSNSGRLEELDREFSK